MSSDTPLTLEQRLAQWASQPGAFVTAAEWEFIQHMRDAARCGVGYGWMQQIIEWEWDEKSPHSWGPEYHERQLAALRAECARLKAGEECHSARPGEGTLECRVDNPCLKCERDHLHAENEALKRDAEWLRQRMDTMRQVRAVERAQDRAMIDTLVKNAAGAALSTSPRYIMCADCPHNDAAISKEGG